MRSEVRLLPDPPVERAGRRGDPRPAPQPARGHSSAGRAPALHAGGREFDPPWLHQGAAGRAGEGRERGKAEGASECRAASARSRGLAGRHWRPGIFNSSGNAHIHTPRPRRPRRRVPGGAAREKSKWRMRPPAGGRLGLYGQANKRIRWMPRRQEAMKDVAACEKPRRGGKQPMTRGCPNGETRPACWASRPESIGAGGEPGELKHLSTPRKRNQPRFPK